MNDSAESEFRVSPSYLYTYSHRSILIFRDLRLVPFSKPENQVFKKRPCQAPSNKNEKHNPKERFLTTV